MILLVLGLIYCKFVHFTQFILLFFIFLSLVSVICRILYFCKQGAINLNWLAWERKKRQHQLSYLESSTHLPTSEVGSETRIKACLTGNMLEIKTENGNFFFCPLHDTITTTTYLQGYSSWIITKERCQWKTLQRMIFSDLCVTEVWGTNRAR